MATGIDGKDKKPVTPGRARRVLGFFTPDLGSGPAQVRETHGIFLQILASLFASVNILGRDHPYLQPGTKFSLGDLFATTLAKIDWKNRQQLPQTVFFCAVWGLLASTVLYVVTAVLLFVATPSHAYAQEASGSVSTAGDGSGMFDLKDKDNDLAQQFLHNLVEGKPITAIHENNANSGTSQELTTTGPIQTAFRAMLKYYSSVILIIASFMVLYHIIMLIVNSAWSGKPLEGANQIWGPLRLAIAIGLLVPLSGGLNAGQYIVLKAAEVGSAAGTKIWNIFTDQLADASGKVHFQPDDKIRNEFMKMILVKACAVDIPMYAGGNVLYKISKDEEKYPDGTARSLTLGYNSGLYIDNYCGTITFPDARISSTTTGLFTTSHDNATVMEQLSSDIRKITSAAGVTLSNRASDIAKRLVTYNATFNAKDQDNPDNVAQANESKAGIERDIRWALYDYYDTVNNKVVEKLKTNSSWEYLKNSSWALAGAYYMQVSSYQSTVFSAVKTPPSVDLGQIFGRLPRSEDAGGAADWFAWATTKGGALYATPEEKHFVDMINGPSTPYNYTNVVKDALFGLKGPDQLAKDLADRQSTNGQTSSVVTAAALATPEGAAILAGKTAAGAINAAISMDKGTFIDMFKDSVADPLAAFVNAGHYILGAGEAAFAAGVIALVGAEVQGSFPIFGGGVTATVAFAGWIMTLAIYLVSLGGLLCFILPLVPVIKFLGGVITWMLSIMEAVIGMPLFALAHLTPGGNGLLDPARHGYIMLFHIAIRPMLMIFGMIVAIIIISPALMLLNAMFMPAVNSAWQPDDGGLILALIMLTLWAFFAYSMLKKVFTFQDHISHATMRWLGGGGYQFERGHGEQNAFASAVAFQQVSGMASKAIGSVGGNVQKRADKKQGIRHDESKVNKAAFEKLEGMEPDTKQGWAVRDERMASPEYKAWKNDKDLNEQLNKQNDNRLLANAVADEFAGRSGDKYPKLKPGPDNNDPDKRTGPDGPDDGGPRKFLPGPSTGGGSNITDVNNTGRATARTGREAFGPQNKDAQGGAVTKPGQYGSSYSLGLNDTPKGTLSVPAGGESPAEIAQHYDKLGLQKTAGISDVTSAYKNKAQEQQTIMNGAAPGSADYLKAESALKDLGKSNDSLVGRMGGSSSLLAAVQGSNLDKGAPAAPKPGGLAFGTAADAKDQGVIARGKPGDDKGGPKINLGGIAALTGAAALGAAGVGSPTKVQAAPFTPVTAAGSGNPTGGLGAARGAAVGGNGSGSAGIGNTGGGTGYTQGTTRASIGNGPAVSAAPAGFAAGNNAAGTNAGGGSLAAGGATGTTGFTGMDSDSGYAGSLTGGAGASPFAATGGGGSFAVDSGSGETGGDAYSLVPAETNGGFGGVTVAGASGDSFAPAVDTGGAAAVMDQPAGGNEPVAGVAAAAPTAGYITTPVADTASGTAYVAPPQADTQAYTVGGNFTPAAPAMTAPPAQPAAMPVSGQAPSLAPQMNATSLQAPVMAAAPAAAPVSQVAAQGGTQPAVTIDRSSGTPRATIAIPAALVRPAAESGVGQAAAQSPAQPAVAPATPALEISPRTIDYTSPSAATNFTQRLAEIEAAKNDPNNPQGLGGKGRRKR